jgi:hypothetical protein
MRSPTSPPSSFCRLHDVLSHWLSAKRFVWRRALSVSLLLHVCGAISIAEPVPVHHKEGSIHGFLALRTMEGKIIAEGDLIQVAQGDRVICELVFHFRDGSIDSDTAIFSQRGYFRLISDHHIQRGPSFPKPTDVTISASGQVTARYNDKGEKKVETSHLDLPPDVANGIILDVLKNISPETKETKVSYVVAAPKPQLVKLSISPQGEDQFSVVGVRQKAMRFVLKVELGGLKGVLAPLAGKQPADTNVWIAGGKAPAFVRSDGPSYLGAPIWSIQMTSPNWSSAPLRR